LRVWGITIDGAFYGFVSGVIAKPLIGFISAVVISALGLGAYWAIPLVWTGSHDNPVRISEPQKEAIVVLRGHTGEVNDAVFAPDGGRLLTASYDKTARLWDRDGKPLAVLRGHDGAVLSASLSPDGRRITPPHHKSTRLPKLVSDVVCYDLIGL
jgi:WD40 repeat protein